MSDESKAVCVLILAVASIVVTSIVSITYYSVVCARIGYTEERGAFTSYHGPRR